MAKQNNIQLGLVFSRLTVLSKDGNRFLCSCVCGNETRARANDLTSGFVKSCGCLRREMAAKKAKAIPANLRDRTKHGMYKTTEYCAYEQARNRCLNPNRPDWLYYGGRGILFLFDSFEQFFALLGFKPSSTHSIDRINVDGNYEPGNVRWATPSEQRNNRRDSV
jgi:hypothetical protein